MPKTLSAVLALAIGLGIGLALASPALAITPKKPAYKRHTVTRWQPRSYGFLPGVRTPEQIQADRDRHYWASGPHYYGPAYPRFYRGRWNGGGFGPCYTQTPIGPMWNCGR